MNKIIKNNKHNKLAEIFPYFHSRLPPLPCPPRPSLAPPFRLPSNRTKCWLKQQRYFKPTRDILPSPKYSLKGLYVHFTKFEIRFTDIMDIESEIPTIIKV